MRGVNWFIETELRKAYFPANTTKAKITILLGKIGCKIRHIKSTPQSASFRHQQLSICWGPVIVHNILICCGEPSSYLIRLPRGKTNKTNKLNLRQMRGENSLIHFSTVKDVLETMSKATAKTQKRRYISAEHNNIRIVRVQYYCSNVAVQPTQEVVLCLSVFFHRRTRNLFLLYEVSRPGTNWFQKQNLDHPILY